MTDIRVIGQPTLQDDWLHRFRNLGEDVYVAFRNRYRVSIDEIDSSFDMFHIRDVALEELGAVVDAVSARIRAHSLGDSVFARIGTSSPTRTVVVVLDKTFGERLQAIAHHDLWVIPSDDNSNVVKQMWADRKGDGGEPSVSMWSEPPPAVSEDDWLALLDMIEVHHGEFWREPPLDALSVYGAGMTPPIRAALLEYDYHDVEETALGFLAFKRHAV